MYHCGRVAASTNGSARCMRGLPRSVAKHLHARSTYLISTRIHLEGPYGVSKVYDRPWLPAAKGQGAASCRHAPKPLLTLCLQGALAASKAALAREEGRVAAAVRARGALEAVWAANRQRSGAARTMQRAWRAWRMRRLQQQGRSANQVGFHWCQVRVQGRAWRAWRVRRLQQQEHSSCRRHFPWCSGSGFKGAVRGLLQQGRSA